MNKILIPAAGLAVLVLGFLLPKASPAEEPAPLPVERLPFAPGEQLDFAVKYGVVRAGDARLAVESLEDVNGEPVYRLVSTASSSRFFSTFFTVKDRVESLWSLSRRVPLRFEKHIHEGNYRKDSVIEFDHEQGHAIYENGDRMEIEAGTQDVLSAFYFIRCNRLDVGKSVHVPNHSDGENYPLEVKVVRRETIEVPAGKFRCVVVEPLLKSAGLFKQEGRLTIWLTDDARKMPVLMKSKVAVGSIVAELEGFRMGKPPRSLKGEVFSRGGESMPAKEAAEN